MAEEYKCREKCPYFTKPIRLGKLWCHRKANGRHSTAPICDYEFVNGGTDRPETLIGKLCLHPEVFEGRVSVSSGLEKV